MIIYNDSQVRPYKNNNILKSQHNCKSTVAKRTTKKLTVGRGIQKNINKLNKKNIIFLKSIGYKVRK